MKINYTFKAEIICGLVVSEFYRFEKLEMSLSLDRRLMACQASQTNSPLQSYSRPKKSGLSTALISILDLVKIHVNGHHEVTEYTLT